MKIIPQLRYDIQISQQELEDLNTIFNVFVDDQTDADDICQKAQEWILYTQAALDGRSMI